MTIENLKKQDLIIFECITGSKAYGLDTPESNRDIKGVYILPHDAIYGLTYQEQVNDKKHDKTYYEIRRFIELLNTNNPNVLEMLAMPDDCVLYKHQAFDQLLKRRDMFITKGCKMSFGGYAVQQIKKARGLNKKIVKKMDKERKTPIDFCHIIEINDQKQRSKPLTQWLKHNGFKQELCGLASIPNMRDMYGLYYDHVTHFGKEEFRGKYSAEYKGIISGKDANDIQLSSVEKYAQPEGVLYFNKDAYTVYCREYKEYWHWVKSRNPHRYNDVKKHGKGYDGKNLSHCFRLLEMGTEIAEGKGINVRRSNRNKLLSIRKGKYDYDKLLEEAEVKLKKMEDLFDNSGLPDKVDKTESHQLLCLIRKDFYKMEKL